MLKSGFTVIACAASAVLATAAIGAEVSGPIPAKVGVVKPSKLVKMVSKAKAIEPDTFDLPNAGTAEDPTLVGAQVTFSDLGLTGGSVQYLLGSSGWKALGNPPGAKGYKYKGKDDLFDINPFGTCKIVLIKDKVIKAVCKGSTVALTPPFAGDFSIQLGIPAGSAAAIEYCAVMGGTTKKNDTKILKRKDSPPPVACP